MPKSDFDLNMVNGLEAVRQYLHELERTGIQGGYYSSGWAGKQLDRVIDGIRQELECEGEAE